MQGRFLRKVQCFGCCSSLQEVPSKGALILVMKQTTAERHWCWSRGAAPR